MLFANLNGVTEAHKVCHVLFGCRSTSCADTRIPLYQTQCSTSCSVTPKIMQRHTHCFIRLVCYILAYCDSSALAALVVGTVFAYPNSLTLPVARTYSCRPMNTRPYRLIRCLTTSFPLLAAVSRG